MLRCAGPMYVRAVQLRCRALFLCMAAYQPAMLIRSTEKVYIYISTYICRVCCGWGFIFILASVELRVL